MSTSKDPLPKVPPFVERKTEPLHKTVDTRGMLSLATMFASLSALSVSMGGAVILVFAIFDDGLANSLDGLLVKVIVLGFAFMFGWGAGLVSIRGFGNLIYPIIIKIYAWGSLVAICILYIKVIQKLYLQKYDTMHFWAYLVMLLGGLFVLISLHLLIEDHDLRPFAIPLLIISVLQLFVTVFRHVLDAQPDGWKLAGDITIFLMMISISSLMLMHIGILSPMRDQIGELFSQEQKSEENGNGGE